ncbi:MAG: DUF5009 domain-containing protein [Promethearchaeota archaeon]|nr:MAG: DUF5009 domain-containing protein [Candidatus Lokiarchaeota archaeon]
MISSIDFQAYIKNRYLSIDFLKGLIILFMVFVNTLGYFDTTPFWTRHADVYGLTYVDLIAPFFIFLLTINFHLSFQKRVKEMNKIKLYRHYIIRNLILLGLGLVLYIDASGDQFRLRWGTLQVISTTALMILLFAETPPVVRLLVGTLLLLFYQIFLLPTYNALVYDSIEGGLIGTLSWGSMGLISSFLSSGLLKGKVRKYFLFFGLLILLIGIILAPIWGISRFLLTLPFNLISIGISSVLFYVIYYIFEGWEKREQFKFLTNDNFITILGKNSLILFLIHLILINIFFAFLPEDLPTFFTFPLAFLSTFIIWFLGYFFYKSEIIFKL